MKRKSWQTNTDSKETTNQRKTKQPALSSKTSDHNARQDLLNTTMRQQIGQKQGKRSATNSHTATQKQTKLEWSVVKTTVGFT